MVFSLFQAMKSRSDELGTSQHHFVPRKGIMKSLDPFSCFLEVSWRRAKSISVATLYCGISQFYLSQIIFKTQNLFSVRFSVSQKAYFSNSTFRWFVFSIFKNSILAWVIRVFCWHGFPQPAQGHLSNENAFLKFFVKANYEKREIYLQINTYSHINLQILIS